MTNGGSNLARRLRKQAGHYEAMAKWAGKTPQEEWRELILKNSNLSPPYALPPYVFVKPGFGMNVKQLEFEIKALYRQRSMQPEYADFSPRPYPPSTTEDEVTFVWPEPGISASRLARKVVDVLIDLEESTDFPNNLKPEQQATLDGPGTGDPGKPNLRDRIAAVIEKRGLEVEEPENEVSPDSIVDVLSDALSSISPIGEAEAASPAKTTPRSLASRTWVNPTGRSKRKCDQKWGCGHFGANRTGANGRKRQHRGQDYLATPGQSVVAVADGVVTKIGHVYSDDLSYRYVEIETSAGIRARHFYVRPDAKIKLGARVTAGEIIGQYQGLQRRFKGIPDHVHLEIIVAGKRVDPAKLIP